MDVCETTTLSRSTLLRLVYENKFPKPFRISGRRMAWYQREIEQWMKSNRGQQGGGYEDDAYGNINNN